MIHADRVVVDRLEELICTEYCRLVEIAHSVLSDTSAECLAVAGGVALWLGRGSPVNLAVGLGMNGPVAKADIQRLETFYRERGTHPRASLCPLADPSLFLTLGRQGWRVCEFEHVLVLEVGDEWSVAAQGAWSGNRPEPGSKATYDVRVCRPHERDTWARVAALGLSEGSAPGRGGEEFGKIMAGRAEAVLVWAWVDGEPAGSGALVVTAGSVGSLEIPRCRGTGGRASKRAIQRHRLQLAHDAGCDLAVAEAAPGSASHRNMERLGYQIAYTHVEFTADA